MKAEILEGKKREQEREIDVTLAKWLRMIAMNKNTLFYSILNLQYDVKCLSVVGYLLVLDIVCHSEIF